MAPQRAGLVDNGARFRSSCLLSFFTLNASTCAAEALIGGATISATRVVFSSVQFSLGREERAREETVVCVCVRLHYLG